MTHRKLTGWMERLGLMAVILVTLTGFLHAANAPGVARISLMDGEVSMLRQGDTSWTSAALNTPLVSGDEVYVADAGRLELELDANDAVRLAGGSDLRISRFFGTDLQLQLRTGTLSYTAADSRNFLPAEIQTPNMSVRLLRAGVLRVDVVDATHTSVTVWHGRAEVFAANGRVEVHEGQQIQVQGATETAEYQIVAAPELDTWDQWVQQREDRAHNARSIQYVSPGIYGVEDLDNYGNWITIPDYGSCWRPSYFVSDWSPYYYGRWLWTPYYGWSWVSYEPWGWAPYHFGRWFWTPRWGWVWWPGRRHIHPIWAPAYVRFFFGHGRAVQGLGFGPGVVGWVPLAPFEPFFGFSRLRTITQVKNVTAINPLLTTPESHPGRLPVPPVHLRNATAPGGFIVVSSEDFANGRVDQGGRMISPVHLSGFHPIRGTPPVVPTARSLQPLPGHIAVPPPAHVAALPLFHQGTRVRRPTPAPLTLPQITHAMVSARRAAGLPALDIVRPHRVPPTATGRSAFMRTPSMPAPPAPARDAIRIERPTRGPLLLTNEGPARTPAISAPGAMGRMTPFRPPAATTRQPHSEWHSFGRPAAPPRSLPMPTPAPRPGVMPTPSPRITRPAMPSPVPWFRHFSQSGPVGPTRGISRSTSNGSPVISAPPRPPSATLPNLFQNHPMGRVVMPVIVSPDRNTGNWTWHAGAVPHVSGSTPAPIRPQPQPGRLPSAPVMTQPAAPPMMVHPPAMRPAPTPRMAVPEPSGRMSHSPGRG